MFIRNNSAWINKEIAFEVMELKRSSYYEWEANEAVRLKKLEATKALEAEVITEFMQQKKRYGATRLTDTNCNLNHGVINQSLLHIDLTKTG